MGYSSAIKKKGQTTNPCNEMEESQKFTEQKKLHKSIQYDSKTRSSNSYGTTKGPREPEQS